MRLFIVGLLLISFFGCKQETRIPEPENLLSEEKYMDVFLELELLRIYQNRGASSMKVDSLYDEILQKYEVTDSAFLNSHAYYQTQIDAQQVRIDSVVARIERELIPLNRLDSLLQAQESVTKE